jgi:phosphonatase-like hydrolase
MPGTEDVFTWCRQQNIKVVTDTGFHRDINNAIMDGLGWLKNGLIDLSVDIETTHGVGRPAPYMIFHTMQQLGVQSVHEVVKIGDTPADLLSGFNAGCAGNIGVLSGANTKETLSKYPHTHMLNSINDLPELLT